MPDFLDPLLQPD